MTKNPRFIVLRWIWGVPGVSDAITLPPLGILIEDEDVDKQWLRYHERGHWQQALDWGLFKYYFLIGWQYAVWGITRWWTKQPYTEIEVEKDATNRGRLLAIQDAKEKALENETS